MSFISVRREIAHLETARIEEAAWWKRALAGSLPVMGVGGKRITPRRTPRRKHLVAHK